jgi:hypothetical protein
MRLLIDTGAVKFAAAGPADTTSKVTASFGQVHNNRSFDSEYDEIEPHSDPAETAGDVLARLVHSGYLSRRDGEVLVRTHIHNEGMKVSADERGISYRTLQSQRLRAEKAAQVFLLREGNLWSRLL